MAIRSHVDPCLFVVFMHIQRPQIGDDLDELLAALQVRHGDPVQPIFERLHERSHQVFFHESYHFWQGLRLPFLYRYASLAFRTMFLAFRQLSEHTDEFLTWDVLLPELHRLDIDTYAAFARGGRIAWSGKAGAMAGADREIQLTPLGLLECAASLAEFQVMSVGMERVNPDALRRWAKRNPSYLEIFDFAADFLEDRTLALRCLLPLINASFTTSHPERTFVELLARTWGTFVQRSKLGTEFLAQPEPCRWQELFRLWVSKIEFEAKDDSYGGILGGPYHRLNLRNWVRGGFGEEGQAVHPFLAGRALEWEEAAAANPILEWALDMPGWMGSDALQQIRSTFDPPVTVLRFHTGDEAGRVILFGMGDVARPVVDLDPSSMRGAIADIVTMYGAVRRASGAHFDAFQRTCHHQGCPFYEKNYCNAYVIIPEDHARCGFPARIDSLIQTWRKPDAHASA